MAALSRARPARPAGRENVQTAMEVAHDDAAGRRADAKGKGAARERQHLQRHALGGERLQACAGGFGDVQQRAARRRRSADADAKRAAELAWRAALGAKEPDQRVRRRQAEELQSRVHRVAHDERTLRLEHRQPHRAVELAGLVAGRAADGRRLRQHVAEHRRRARLRRVRLRRQHEHAVVVAVGDEDGPVVRAQTLRARQRQRLIDRPSPAAAASLARPNQLEDVETGGAGVAHLEHAVCVAIDHVDPLAALVERHAAWAAEVRGARQPWPQRANELTTVIIRGN